MKKISLFLMGLCFSLTVGQKSFADEGNNEVFTYAERMALYTNVINVLPDGEKNEWFWKKFFLVTMNTPNDILSSDILFARLRVLSVSDGLNGVLLNTKSKVVQWFNTKQTTAKGKVYVWAKRVSGVAVVVLGSYFGLYAGYDFLISMNKDIRWVGAGITSLGLIAILCGMKLIFSSSKPRFQDELERDPSQIVAVFTDEVALAEFLYMQKYPTASSGQAVDASLQWLRAELAAVN